MSRCEAQGAPRGGNRGAGPRPRPTGSKKLKGEDHAWRVRVGDYRVLYEVNDAQLVVLVIRIAKREDAYR